MIIEPNDPSTVLSSHRIDSFRTKIITFTLLLRFTIDIIIYGSWFNGVKTVSDYHCSFIRMQIQTHIPWHSEWCGRDIPTHKRVINVTIPIEAYTLRLFHSAIAEQSRHALSSSRTSCFYNCSCIWKTMK